mmetsp:Transcript_34114/g.64280  ORF Transcript_34114/g.64280 Transcript_34114/m.64280 type:complete len:500 (-) Transcript_34114:67-1566(-)
MSYANRKSNMIAAAIFFAFAIGLCASTQHAHAPSHSHGSRVPTKQLQPGLQETHSASTLDQHSPQTPLWERNMSTIPTYHQMRAGMRDCSLEACFDFARCTTGMKVYVYPSALWSRVSSHVKQGYDPCEDHQWMEPGHQSYQECFLAGIATHFDVVSNPEEACILVPSIDLNCAFNQCKRNLPEIASSTDRRVYFKRLPHWNDGLNHVILNYNNDFTRPLSLTGRAMVIRGSWVKSTFRRQFDVQLPLSKPRMMKFSQAERSMAQRAQRDLLLYFRGCIYKTVASQRAKMMKQYMETPAARRNDVVLFGMCCSTSRSRLPWAHPSIAPRMPNYCKKCGDPNAFKHSNGGNGPCAPDQPNITMREGQLRSKFIMCPRGIGSLSYRLIETIESGAVPVFLGDDSVMPFAGSAGAELTKLWQNCLVPISEQSLRKAFFISKLAGMSSDKYQSHLMACRNLQESGSLQFSQYVVEGLCQIQYHIKQRMSSFPMDARCLVHWNI